MRHILSVLVENEPGVLSRVAGLFSGRGFNIESLNVAPTLDPETSHMTITTFGDDQILEQIVPFFTPQLTVTIKDIELYDLNTNITFDLTAVSQDIQYESVFDDKKLVMFNFSFIANTKFHSNPRSIQRIKDVIINMSEKDDEDVEHSGECN